MEKMEFQKKAVLWDLDDTLHSRVEAARRLFPGMFRQCLYPKRSDAFIEEAVAYMMTKINRKSMVHEDAFRALLERYPADKPYVRADCVAYYYQHIRDFAVPFPETMQIIRKLKAQGVKMAIVTNITPELLEHQHKKVEALGIAALFDAIIYSSEVGFHKPDRRIFDHAAAVLGVSNEECLFVGDDPDSDIAGALAAGMEAVWLDRWNCGDRFAGNDRVCRVQSAGEYFGKLKKTEEKPY